MRILVLSNLFPPHYIGGYELRCQTVVNALRARGHVVQVLTSNHGVAATPAKSAETGVSRTLRIHGFFGHPWLGIRKLRELELHNNRVLRDAVDQFRPDLVHVWNLGGLSKSLCLTIQQLAVPAVFDVSDHWIARSLVADVWLDWWNRQRPALPARLLRSPLAEVKSYDGVKFIAQDSSWLMLRGSGTEPILRIYAEAKSDADVQKLLQAGVRLTRQV